MFKPFNRRVIISLEERLNSGLKAVSSTNFLPPISISLFNAVQSGTVVAVQDGCDLQEGDKIYVHHFVLEKEHIIPVVDKKISWIEFNQCFARVRDGEVKALGEYVLVEPMKYSHPMIQNEVSGLELSNKSANDEVERIGIVAHVSEKGREYGLKPGDIILFGRNCEYDIVIENHKYYKMHMGDIITVLGEGLKILSVK